jgi:ketosteroid isomerase-like protein
MPGFTSDPESDSNVMASHETRALINDLYETLGRGDRAHLMELLAPDVIWQMPASIPNGMVRGAELVAEQLSTATVRRLFQRGTFRLTIHNLWVQDHVAIAQTGAHAVTHAGADYDMEYVWIYTCSAGRVSHVREYLDTLHAAHVIGADNIGGPKPE